MRTTAGVEPANVPTWLDYFFYCFLFNLKRTFRILPIVGRSGAVSYCYSAFDVFCFDFHCFKHCPHDRDVILWHIIYFYMIRGNPLAPFPSMTTVAAYTARDTRTNAVHADNERQQLLCALAASLNKNRHNT